MSLLGGQNSSQKCKLFEHRPWKSTGEKVLGFILGKESLLPMSYCSQYRRPTAPRYLMF